MDADYYAKSVKISLSKAERAWISERADALVQSFDALDAIDTEAAEPLVRVLAIDGIMRPDISEKRFSREDILKNAPECADGYFVAPKVME